MFKNKPILIAVGVGLLIGVPVLATPALEKLHKIFQGGGVTIVKTGAQITSSNKVTGIFGATCDYDFPALGGGNDMAIATRTCTVSGAVADDPCFSSQVPDAGVLIQCTVPTTGLVSLSALNLREDAGVNLADAGYRVRVISNQ